MSAAAAVETHHLDGRSCVEMRRGCFDDHTLDDALAAVRDGQPLRQETITMFGRQVQQPRLTAVAGINYDPATRYRTERPYVPFGDLLGGLADLAQASMNDDYGPGDWVANSMIANYYRDGRDSISWHRDNEPALGDEPQVAAISFGGERHLLVRRRGEGKILAAIPMRHGDLVLMRGRMQVDFEHAIGKIAYAEPRLSLTFRRYHD